MLIIVLSILNGGWICPSPDKYEKYIKIAVSDFLKKSPLSKKDKVFRIGIMEFENEIVGINIFGANTKLSAVRDSNGISITSLPSRFLEMNNKLFYWQDKECIASSDMLMVLKKYNFLDTIDLNHYIPSFNIDDAKQAEDYYFCKKNISKFKKIRTKWAMGHYPVPKINCSN